MIKICIKPLYLVLLKNKKAFNYKNTFKIGLKDVKIKKVNA